MKTKKVIYNTILTKIKGKRNTIKMLYITQIIQKQTIKKEIKNEFYYYESITITCLCFKNEFF